MNQNSSIEFPTQTSIVGRHQLRSKKFTKMERRLNKIIIFLYKINLLPLFGFGKSFAIIYTIGRKTSKIRKKPVLAMIFHTGKLTLYSARGMKSDWLKNILASEDKIIYVHKGFKKIRVKATLIQDFQEKYEHLKYWFANFPSAKVIFGYDKKEHGDVFQEDNFNKLVNIIEFIQLEKI